MTQAKENQENTTQTTQQENGDEQQTAQQSSQMSNRQWQQTGMARREQFAPSMFITSPFSLMRLFNEELSRLFREVGSSSGTLAPRSSDERAAVWSPQIDVSERDGQLVIRADLPGIDKNDVEIELLGDSIVLRGERREERREERQGIYHTEVFYGSFYRRIPLPEGADPATAKASFNNGVLEITMQAPQRETRGSRLEIQDTSATSEQSQENAAQNNS